MRFNLKLEHINYISLYTNDNQSNTATYKAMVKSINDTEIIAFTKYQNESAEIKPQDVKIKLVCDDGLYIIKTKINKIEKDLPYLILRIETPKEMEFSQNREFFRIKSAIECSCETNIDDVTAKYIGKIVNLSANGICAIFPNKFIVNNICNINFSLENRKLSLKARYVRSDFLKNEYKVSFNFVKISESDKDFISKICIKKQLENKRKNFM